MSSSSRSSDVTLTSSRGSDVTMTSSSSRRSSAVATVSSAELVELAESYLRSSKRRRSTNQMESLWLCLHAVIILEHAVEITPDSETKEIVLKGHTRVLPQISRETVHTKLAAARHELYNYVKDMVQGDVMNRFDLNSNKPSIDEWMMSTLTYFKEKFTPESHALVPTGTQSALTDTIPEENGKPSPREESALDKISYQKMLLAFNTSTAAKYGVNVLDASCQKTIEDYRNGNVRYERNYESFQSSQSLQSSNPFEPTIHRRASSGILSGHRHDRPSSLALQSSLSSSTSSLPSISRRLSSVVSELKSKAERLRRRNTVTSPVVPWQTAIKQHQSMIAEVLNEFHVEHANNDETTADHDDFINSHRLRTTTGHCDSFPTGLGDVSPREYFIRGLNRAQSLSSLHHNDDQYSCTTSSSHSTNYHVHTRHIYSRAERMEAQLVEHSVSYQTLHTTTQTITQERSNGKRSIPFDRNGNFSPSRPFPSASSVMVTYSRSGSLTPDSVRPPKLEQRRSYSLHNFEPVSPLTEISTTLWQERDPNDEFDSWSPGDFLSQSAISISQDDILLALSRSVHELADQHYHDQKYDDAQNLYEQCLSILKRMYDYTGKFQPSIVLILRQCGLIRKHRGDSLGALGIFEQAIQVVEKRENGYCSVEYQILIAELCYEMGNALIIEGKHSETVGNSVITLLRDREMADFMDAPRSVCSDLDLELSYNAFTSKGQSYPVGAFEALSCYQKAYCKIARLKTEQTIEHELFAKVMLKIGDCSVLIADLEVAGNFYEDALDTFKAGTMTSSLSDHAHVLVMIGFLQYVSGQYSKALIVLQCATIMFRRMETTNVQYERSEFALVMALLCLTNFATDNHSRAVSTGLQAKLVFDEIFNEDLENANETITWLVAQTLFTVARSYSAMNMMQDAISTLENLTQTFGPDSNLDKILRVRILEQIGNCYEATNCEEKALEFYNEALSDYREQTNLGYTCSALEYTLLSRRAGLHITMQPYDAAPAYVDSYDGVSRDVESDIRSDMVTLLHHLGETHTLAGHVQRAIDCYTECIDVYTEIHGQLGPDMVKTLGKLANMYHLSAVESEDEEKSKELILKAEKLYREAMDLDFTACLALRYANFLFHQNHYIEAIYILQQLLSTVVEVGDVTFAGVEQVLVPVLLQSECDDDEIVLPAMLLVRYLLVLSFSAIRNLRSAEYYALDMIYEFDDGSDDTMALSVIGYAMLELRLYMEAYDWFERADRCSMYTVPSVAWENKIFCVALELYRCLCRGVLFLYECYHGLGTFPSTLPYMP